MVQKTINELKAKYPDKPLLSSLPEFLQDLPEFPYVPVGVDVQGWIKQLTAGLVYNAVDGFDQSIEWDEVFVMSPDMLETNTPPFSEQELQEQLKRLQVKQAEVQRLNSYFWFDGWKSGPNPYPANIYHFQVSFLPDFVYLKHRFYNTFNWYVPFRPLPNTIRKLKEKIGITA